MSDYRSGESYKNGKNAEVSGLEKVRSDTKNKAFLITVDFSSKTPVFMQIVENVVGLVATGELEAGTILPSSRKLSSLLGINYHTVNKSYEALVREGFATMDKKRVVIIGKRPLSDRLTDDQAWKNKIRIIIAEAVSRGYSRNEIMRAMETLLDEMESGDRP
jgi:DNA-binding transcriptional regulator YhcF (GntR family)